jgi:hypothetical protein
MPLIAIADRRCFGAPTLTHRYPLPAASGLMCVKRAKAALAAAAAPREARIETPTGA